MRKRELGRVNCAPVAMTGLACWPSSHTRQTTLLGSPSASETLQAMVTDANDVSDLSPWFGLMVSVTIGGLLRNWNVSFAGFGSATPRLSMART